MPNFQNQLQQQQSQSQKESQKESQQKRRLQLLLNIPERQFQSNSISQKSKEFYKKILQNSNKEVTKIKLNLDEMWKNWSEEEDSQFFKLMKNNQSIREILLEGASFDLRKFCTDLSDNQILKKLTIDVKARSGGDKVNFLLFLRTIGSNLTKNSLESLSVNNYIIDQAGFKEISMINFEKLTHLSLQSSCTSSMMIKIKYICRLIENNKYLQELNLDHNSFGDEELDMIHKALKRNSTLKKLTLENEDDFNSDDSLYHQSYKTKHAESLSRINNELRKNQLLPNIINYINKNVLPFPIPVSKFIFEKLIIFLDQYIHTLIENQKLKQLELQRIKYLDKINQKIIEIQKQVQQDFQKYKNVNSTQLLNRFKKKKQRLDDLQNEKEFLAYVQHDKNKIQLLEKRIHTQKERLFNKILKSDEITKNLNSKLTALKFKKTNLEYQLENVPQNQENVPQNQDEIDRINNQIEKTNKLIYIIENPNKLEIRDDKVVNDTVTLDINDFFTLFNQSAINNFKSILLDDIEHMPRYVIKNKLKDFIQSDQNLEAIFNHVKLERQIRQEIDRIEKQNQYIKSHNKQLEEFHKKNSVEALEKFYSDDSIIELPVEDYTITKIDNIRKKYYNYRDKKYRNKKVCLEDALLVFFQEFREYPIPFDEIINLKSIDNFEYVKGVRTDAIIELNFIPPIYLFFILQYLELYAIELYKEIPDKYKNKVLNFQLEFSEENILIFVNHLEKKRYSFDFQKFYNQVFFENSSYSIYFPMFIMVMRILKKKYMYIYRQISTYINNTFRTPIEIENEVDIKIDILLINLDILSSKNNNYSLILEWNKHNYLHKYVTLTTDDYVSYLFDLKKNFPLKYKELPKELTTYAKLELDSDDKQKAQFVFGKRKQGQKQKQDYMELQIQRSSSNLKKQDNIKLHNFKKRKIPQQQQHYTKKQSASKGTKVRFLGETSDELLNRQQISQLNSKGQGYHNKKIKLYPLEQIKLQDMLIRQKAAKVQRFIDENVITVNYPTSYDQTQTKTFTIEEETKLTNLLINLKNKNYRVDYFLLRKRGKRTPEKLTFKLDLSIDEIKNRSFWIN